MGDGEIPKKDIQRFVDLEQELFGLAHKHGIRLAMDVRWPDGFHSTKRTMNEREKKQRAARRALEEGPSDV